MLDWPYKDCLLEGGQTKEDQKRDEVFFNEILAPDQITTILEDKVFTNWKRYDKDGEHKLDKLSPNDNLIIKGNNLVVLHSLKKRFAGRIKLIYIDPPYNTGGDGFNYNDRFSHSTWLTFMKNRLEVARDLLSDDGAIYVQMDVKEAHYLKVLMDEVFGRDNFRSEIIWDTSIPYVAGSKWMSNNWIYSHSQIFYYAKHKASVFFNKLTFDVQQPSGDVSKKPHKDVWIDIKNFSGFLGAKDYKMKFNTRKPEHLIKRIILASTNPGDIVLDYHLGSGTTAAVAHKLGRQYIGVEQMGYLEDDSIPRLNAVIDGEQAGISKDDDVSWTGGGSFVYCNIKNDANTFREKVKSAKESDLAELLDEVLKSSFLSYRVDPKKVNKKEFGKLSLADKKRILLNLVDNNTLYMNYSEIDDAVYGVSDEDKKFNKQFYTEID